ncbi:MAG: ABC-F family ATP-binding cassette domain-containing protein [Candidatus Cloacimonetes bacterium]|nr:ABC-F family ATP-binding cassette domain-containing protein [Candidatus Cloacimonadota bacterium]
MRRSHGKSIVSLAAISNISHHFGGQPLFEGVSLSIEQNSRFGLVGPNGSGKSTLFDILCDRVTPAEGEVHRARGRRIARLTQEVDLDESLTLWQTAIGARSSYVERRTALDEAEQAVSAAHTDANMAQLEQAQEAFLAIDGYNYEHEVKLVLHHLGLPRQLWEQRMNSFSGGEKTRVQLARILLEPFDVLLLDEPTNHLDFRMIFWLERYLRGLDRPYVIISHDRHFLDKTVDTIYEIRSRGLVRYGGNYSYYARARHEQDEQQLREWKRQQRFISKTEAFIRKNMAGQKVSQAKSRLKMLDRIEHIEKPTRERAIRIRIDSDGRSGNDVFRFRNADIAIGGHTLATGVDEDIFYRDRIAVIGRNGCGKTTLLRTLAGEHNIAGGSLYHGANLQVGYYDQMHVCLDDSLSVMETAWSLMPGAPQGEVFGYLARFGFRGDDTAKQVGVLSGGERSRLYLAKLVWEKPNLLLLDEPTNHLDLPTIEALETALQDYAGTIVFVSHDLYFVQAVATRTWHFHDGIIENTTLDPEQIFNRELEKGKPAKTQPKQAPQQRSKRVNPIVLKKLMADIESLEQRRDACRAELDSLQHRFADPATYTHTARVQSLREKIAAKQAEIEVLDAEIEAGEERYLGLSEDEA